MNNLPVINLPYNEFTGHTKNYLAIWGSAERFYNLESM